MADRRARREQAHMNLADLKKVHDHPRILGVSDEDHLVLIELSEVLSVLKQRLGRLAEKRAARRSLEQQVRKRFAAFENAGLPPGAADEKSDKVESLLQKAAQLERSDPELAQGFRDLAEDEQRQGVRR
jgi:hypothetical protein